MKAQRLFALLISLVLASILSSVALVASANCKNTNGSLRITHTNKGLMNFSTIHSEHLSIISKQGLVTNSVVLLPIIIKGYKPVDWPIKGASLTAYWHDSYSLPDAFDQIDYLEITGANSLSLLVNWYQDTTTSTVMYRSPTKTVPDEDLETIIAYAHQNGISIALKPHLEVIVGGWRGWLDPIDHEGWFANYADFMTHYAKIAERNDVEILIIGTEYRSLTQENEDLRRWADLADNLRKVYSGNLSYAAHESGVLGKEEGYEVIPPWFWEHFDYAGTTVYYTLSRNKTPSVDELTDAWHETLDLYSNLAHYVDELQAWQNTHGKPVIFAEIGYRSVDCAANKPFQVAGSQCPDPPYPMEYNELAQSNAYEAFFQVFENTHWLAGVYWWQFEIRPVSNRECAEGLAEDTNFTPCGKSAGEVLSWWYGGDDSTPPPAYVPSLPSIDDFEYISGRQPIFDRVWVDQSSGKVSYIPTSSIHLPVTGSQQSLFISTTIPLADTPRYQQLVYNFGQAQDFGGYNSIELWVKADGINEPPFGGEFSVVLVDGDNEPWQSTRWLNRNSGVPESNGWEHVMISLTNTGDIIGNPWHHPVDFIIPEWATDSIGNGVFDLDEIKEVWIKSLTTDTTPEFVVWIDDLRLSTEVIGPFSLSHLPSLDLFKYQGDVSLPGNYEKLAVPR